MYPQGSQVRWVVLAGALAALPWLPARGDEGGTPFWLSGQYASLAAVPPSPRWSLSAMLYGYSGSAAAVEALPRSAALANRLEGGALFLTLNVPLGAPAK